MGVSSEAVTFDMRTGSLVAAATPLFLGVEVGSPAPPPRGASRAQLDRFLAQFDASVAAVGRRYALHEAVAAVQAAFGEGVSAREAEAALGRISPTALAGPGRRRVVWTPSPAELAEAARLAAENTA